MLFTRATVFSANNYYFPFIVFRREAWIFYFSFCVLRTKGSRSHL